MLVKWVSCDNKRKSWIPKTDIQNLSEGFDEIEVEAFIMWVVQSLGGVFNMRAFMGVSFLFRS